MPCVLSPTHNLPVWPHRLAVDLAGADLNGVSGAISFLHAQRSNGNLACRDQYLKIKIMSVVRLRVMRFVLACRKFSVTIASETRGEIAF